MGSISDTTWRRAMRVPLNRRQQGQGTGTNTPTHPLKHGRAHLSPFVEPIDRFSQSRHAVTGRVDLAVDKLGRFARALGKGAHL